MKSLLLLLAVSGMILPGTAQSQVIYTPARQGDNVAFIGNAKTETMNVAIAINDPAMEGKTITDVSVPFPKGSNPTAVTAWLTQKLNIGMVSGSRKNIADICEVQATVNDTLMTAHFTQPVTIPAGGLYAGYTFSVIDSVAAKPIAVSKGMVPGKLYLYSTRKYMSWADHSEDFGYVSAMKVTLNGDFPQLATALTLPEHGYYNYNKNEYVVNAFLTGHGAGKISEISYSYSSPLGNSNDVYHFAEPIELQYGHSLEVKLPIKGMSKKGVQPLKLSLDKINSTANPDAYNKAEMEVEGLYRLPVNRPLVEEYTGLWCGYCPRGTAGMEHMKNTYPDEFVVSCFHNEDEMTIMDKKDYPCATNTYPCAWINRHVATDPYNGNFESGFGFDQIWETQRKDMPIADLTASAWWDKENPDVVNVDAEVVFVRPSDRKYRLGYQLLCDALENPEWEQTNYYAGWKSMGDIEEMYEFINGSTLMHGNFYNDVVVKTSDHKGVPESLPETMTEDTSYHHHYTFNTTEAVSSYGENLVQDKDYVKVVVYLIEQTAAARIINSCLAYVGEESSVSALKADNQSVKTTYYDLQGRRVLNPEHGLFIKVETSAAGVNKSTKVAL